MTFIHDDFLLSNDPARRLYHDHAATMPIYDYHCHLPAVDLARNRRFENLAEIAELRDGETFKLIYDFGNYLGTGVPPMDIWQMFRDRTDCFHFKDKRQDGQHVPMGRGDTQAEAILRDAHARGWRGPCVIEPHLTHSKAVLATGAHGTGDRSLASLSPADSFQVAVEAARDLLALIHTGK